MTARASNSPDATSIGQRLDASPAYRYEVLGHVVVSDLPLVGRKPVDGGRVSLTVRSSELPAVTDGALLHEMREPDGRLRYQVQSHAGAYVWHYPGIADFVVSRAADEVSWCLAEDGSKEDAGALLSGAVIVFALQLRGLTALHATVVVHEGAGIAIAAPAGHGKSTLAAALLDSGCTLLSDDVAAIAFDDETPLALPGASFLKLWPDSAGRFAVKGADSLPSYLSFLDKRTVSLDAATAVCGEPCRLKAVFVLVPVVADAEAAVLRLQGSEALRALLANLYRGDLLVDEPAVQGRHLAGFSRLADALPVFALVCPRSYEKLPALASLVLASS